MNNINSLRNFSRVVRKHFDSSPEQRRKRLEELKSGLDEHKKRLGELKSGLDEDKKRLEDNKKQLEDLGNRIKKSIINSKVTEHEVKEKLSKYDMTIILEYINCLKKEVFAKKVPRYSFTGKLVTYDLLENRTIAQLSEARKNAIKELLKSAKSVDSVQSLHSLCGALGLTGLLGGFTSGGIMAAAGVTVAFPVLIVVLISILVIMGWLSFEVKGGIHAFSESSAVLREVIGDLNNIDHLEKAIIRNVPEQYRDSLLESSLQGLTFKDHVKK